MSIFRRRPRGYEPHHTEEPVELNELKDETADALEQIGESKEAKPRGHGAPAPTPLEFDF